MLQLLKPENSCLSSHRTLAQFLARDVIYTSRAYATMSVSACLSVCLSVCDGSALAHYS